MGDLWSIALGSFVTSALIQYMVIRVSHKYNFFIDLHTEKKPQNFHQYSTPRAGGRGIISAMLFLLLTPLSWKLLVPFSLAFLSGIFEDFHHSIEPKVRLFLQFIAASSAVALMDIVITYLGFDFSMSFDIGVIFSIFAIMGMMNAINIIDGFHGLAAMISLLMLLAFGIEAYRFGDTQIISIIVITLFALVAFLLFNLPRGYIFLGDGGAYLLGFIVATVGIFLAGHHERVSPWFVLTVLIYPVWEVLFSIIRKLLTGHSPLKPDSKHIHMLIYKHITHNNPLTSLLIATATAPFILLPTLYANNSTANFKTTLLFIVLYLLLYRYLSRKEQDT